MHLHGIAVNPNLGSLDAANAAQRSTNAQQAAVVRKKLALPTGRLESDESFESLILLGSAHSGKQQRSQPSDESLAEKDEVAKPRENGDEFDQDEHRSYWA